MMRHLFLVLLLIHLSLAQKAKVKPLTKKWLTLKGDEPVVIARGGYSGLFPDSSEYAYRVAKDNSLPGTILFCDLQLTKDSVGICQTELRLDNSTTIRDVFPKGQKTYNVNGQDMSSWFALDYTSDQLFTNVTLIQNIYSRTNVFDGLFSLWTPDNVVAAWPSSKIWLNVQYGMFYIYHKLSLAKYVEDSMKFINPEYISSPEIGFLKTIGGKLKKSKKKLIFRCLEADAFEPTTKEKYGSLLGNLSMIKSFASGILVPKEYIWPVTKDMYLQPATTLVADAHKQGLEVYASGFANDGMLSYNYSYDPTVEYLQFVDNSQFSVDGVLTDFPSTASEAIACLARNKNASRIMDALIISHNGASGDYPGCTDLAYQKAIDDGADIIDCSVQMSKDGFAFCLETADLTGKTTAATTLMDRTATVPEIQPNWGIFSFDVTWSEIQSLKPQITSPDIDTSLQRNPANRNKGKFVTLSEFLEIAKSKGITGVLINIENAAFLASKKGLSITDAVTTALSNDTLDKVLIQSDDSSVLSKFKYASTYQRVLTIKEQISDAPKQVAEEVKKYADAVSVTRNSIVRDNSVFFSTDFTNITQEMHAANVLVYVAFLRNEFTSLIFDYNADPYTQLATFVVANKVDGVITDNPATTNAYMRSPCSKIDANVSFPILPIKAGDLLAVLAQEVLLPPTPAPAPALEVADIIDPPLPPVANISTNSTSSLLAPAPAKNKSSSQRTSAETGHYVAVIVGIIVLEHEESSAMIKSF
ncbi:unnamed protein product [Ilex paraguariensis]|uniref:glycerophosphodiester phosphodiesterase n=1 Tax=Ilex paraguariensis TaxID=185542 RepID=A0ABC8TH97_9AQUA